MAVVKVDIRGTQALQRFLNGYLYVFWRRINFPAGPLDGEFGSEEDICTLGRVGLEPLSD
jgi:hypothetical protein